MTFNTPKGPSYPSIIQAIKLRTHPARAIRSWTNKYGDPFTLTGVAGPGQSIFFGHPDAIKEILTAHPSKYKDRQGSKIMRLFLGSNSILIIDGKQHRQERATLAPLLQGKQLAQITEKTITLTHKITGQWREGQSISIDSFTRKVTLEIISALIFGDNRSNAARGVENSVIDSIRIFVEAFLPMAILPKWKLLGRGPWEKLERSRDKTIMYITEEIKHKLKNAGNEQKCGIFERLAAESMEGRNNEKSIDLLVDRIVSIIFAGHETTAAALAWAIALIYNDNSKLEKLRKELAGLGDTNCLDILVLPYLNAVCLETLRLYPGPVEIHRVLKEPMSINGWILPAGSRVVPCMQMTHRRPDIFNNPNDFIPERFISNSYTSYEFWPFGEGSRKCLGMHFALTEIKLVLAFIVKHWDLRIEGKLPRDGVARHFNIAPPESLRAKVVQFRENSN